MDSHREPRQHQDPDPERDDPIAMPAGHDDELADEIDEHLPLPTDEPHHDDRVNPDPYDVDDAVDLHVPLPTGEPEDEVDDFSTDEELDVDTAPEGDYHDRLDAAHDARDGERLVVEEAPGSEIEGAEVYVGGPSDDEPVNDESDFYAPGDASDAPDGDATHYVPLDTGDDAAASATSTRLAADGTTKCPTCGRETDALRFCGHCGEQLMVERTGSTADSLLGRLRERASMALAPIAAWTKPGAVRAILAIGMALILLALLANSGALALVLGTAILPLIIVYWCMESDVFDHEPPYVLAAFAFGGTVVGAVLGWLGSLIVTGSWFDEGILNFGAAGFGGRYAEAAGTAPFLVWALVGIVFPIVALAAIVGIPLALRQTFSLRNEVMDGLTLGAVMGAGYAFGSAIIFTTPMVTNGGPPIDARAWTLTTIGLTILRPLIWGLSGALLGAAAWRYLLTGRIGNALIPAAVGAAAPLLHALVSVQIAPTGLWAEILWGVLVATVVALFFGRTLDSAIRQDRQVLGRDNQRLVCPACHQVTPAGQFCANCGATLATA